MEQVRESLKDMARVSGAGKNAWTPQWAAQVKG